MSGYNDMMEEGLAEIESEAGTQLTYTSGGVTLSVPAIIGEPSPAQRQVDAALGRSYDTRITVRRSKVDPTKRPTVGTVFTAPNGAKYRVQTVERGDPDAVDYVYTAAVSEA